MNNRKIGYIRVSDKDQNENRQLDAMLEQGINERDIFIDKVSGRKVEREQYQIMKRVLRSGDVLFIHSIDRFGRKSIDIKREWQEITQDIGADICVLDMPLLDTRQYRDTLGNFVSELVLQVLAFQAEKEVEDIHKRQAEGIASARARGKNLGRPSISYQSLQPRQKEILSSNYEKWKKKLIRSVDFMEMLNLKKSTFYKVIKEYESGKIIK